MVWHEGDHAIGELVHCECPQLAAGGFEVPQRINTEWWQARNITVVANPLGRSQLFSLAQKARESRDPADLLALLWHTLAWGVMGDFRNAATIVRNAETDSGREHLLGALIPAAQASFRGDVESAYLAFQAHWVPRLGRGFFTKFLHFTSDPTSSEPRCMIVDARVASAVFTLTGNDYLLPEKASAQSYGRICRDMHRWAADYETTPELIEFRMYKFGQLTNNARWRWLHAEASLYREGQASVEFCDIVERLSTLRLRPLC